MGHHALKPGDFVQSKKLPGVLLGQIDREITALSRLAHTRKFVVTILPEPTACYMRNGIRTIELPCELEETPKRAETEVYPADVERWDSSALESK